MTYTEVTRPDGSRFVSVQGIEACAVRYRQEDGWSLREVTGRAVIEPDDETVPADPDWAYRASYAASDGI